MAYVKTNWVDNVTTITADKLNNIEGGIETIENKIPAVNTSNSTSATDTYSCSYVNDAIKNDVVWQNPNGTSSFGSQTISLSNNNYKYYEIYYKLIKTIDYIQSVKVLVDKKSVISISAIPGFLGEGRTRRIETITNSQINFGDCTKGTTSTVDNDTIIPYIVVGYK